MTCRIKYEACTVHIGIPASLWEYYFNNAGCYVKMIRSFMGHDYSDDL